MSAPAQSVAGQSGRKRSRTLQTGWDMVRTMAVIGAFVLLVYLLAARPRTVYQPPVDVRAAVLTAADGMGAPGRPARLVTPQVPADWRANAANWRQVGESPTLHVGYLTGNGQYVATEITQRGTQDWVREVTQDGTATGTTQVGSRTWHTYRSADGTRRSWLLVRPAAEIRAATGEQGNRVTTVVTTTGGDQELRTLAGAIAR